MCLVLNQIKKYKCILVVTLTIVSLIVLSGCQQAPVTPKVMKAETQPIGFRDGFFFVKKESTTSERVYYVFDLKTVSRQVFNDDGLIDSQEEGIFTVSDGIVEIVSANGEKRQLTVTTSGDLKSSLGTLWTYAGAIEKNDDADPTGGKIFKDVYEVQTVKPLTATLIRAWREADSDLYYMTFKDSEGEITVEMESPPATGYYNADGSGNDSKIGKRFKLYYLEKESGVRVLVSIEAL